MFIQKSRSLTLTLIFALTLALALITSSEAKPNDTPLPREHVALNRLIRKRAIVNPGPVPVVPPAEPAPSVAPAPTAAPSPSVSVAPPRTSEAAVPSVAPPPSSVAPAPASSTPAAIINSIVSSVVAPVVASSSVPVAVVSSAPVVPTTTAAPVTTAAPLPVTSATVTPKVITSSKKGSPPTIVTLTSEVSAASATATGVPAKNAAMQKTVTTVLIVVASVVGGTAVIWTIIRKWKFSPSNSFEDRMQPIDWQPTNEDTGLPTNRRLSSASSFHSAGHGDNMSAYGGSAYGSTDVHPGAPPLQPIPDHDFTAAPNTHLAPVGGYADLSRGPSPGPYMQDPYRGPSPGPYAQDQYRGPSPGPYAQDQYRGPSPGPQMQQAYRGSVYDGTHDAYDYNGGTRY